MSIKHWVSAHKKSLIVTSGVLLIVGGIASVWALNQSSSSNSSQQQSTTEKPDFSVILPAGTSVDEIEGQMLRPPNSEPVFSYTDTLNGKTITVTQQALPESFKNDVDGQVAQMARSFNATTEIEAGDTNVFIGTSAKGPQSVMFTKNELLLLIKSQEKIDEGAWTIYINSLI